MADDARSALWNRLLATVEALEQSDHTEEELAEQLTAILEAFSFDPVDAYPEYLVVRFCRALQSIRAEDR